MGSALLTEVYGQLASVHYSRLMDAGFWVAVAAVVISVVALIRGEIHQRRSGPEGARRRAVDNVVEALGAVVALSEHADIKMPPSSEISAVMQNFERECLRWEPMIPYRSKARPSQCAASDGSLFRFSRMRGHRPNSCRKACASFRQILVGHRHHLSGTCKELPGCLAGRPPPQPPDATYSVLSLAARRRRRCQSRLFSKTGSGTR